MRNRIWLAVFVILLAGGFVPAFAQGNAGAANPTTTRIKTSKEVTPSWTYKGQYYGFVTCNRLQKDGNMVTPDQVRQCLNGGGTCMLMGRGGQGPSRLDLQPKAKCDEFAGQQVLLTALLTSARYGTGPTSDEAVEGLAAGGDRPASKFEGVTIVSGKVMPKEAPTGRVDTSRMTQSSQQ